MERQRIFLKIIIQWQNFWYIQKLIKVKFSWKIWVFFRKKRQRISNVTRLFAFLKMNQKQILKNPQVQKR